MFPNLFNFPSLNYNPYFNGFYPNQYISSWIAPQLCINPPQIENLQHFQQSDNEKNLKLTLTRNDLQEEGIGISKKHWSQEQDRLLKQYSELYNFDWSQICKKLPGRNQKMCYSRYRRIQNQTKAYWTNKENQDIKKYFEVDKMSWKAISKFFQNRTAKQIRQHYLNFLRPNIKRDEWTLQQDLKIVELYNENGKKWKMFEKNFQGRTQNQIKNRFYGRLRRLQMKKNIFKENSQ